MLLPIRFPVEHLVDVEGRPLREHAAPIHLQQSAAMDLVECKYSGSRFKHQRPMNASALRQMQAHWEDALSGLAYVRSLYPISSEGLNYLQLWQLGKMIASLPAFLTYRSEAPIPNHALPAHIAAMYKIIIGLNGSIRKLARANMVRDPDRSYMAADVSALYAFIDEKNLLIGPKQVCAGPEKLILSAMRVLLDPSIGHARDDKTASIIRHPEQFLAYSMSSFNAMILSGIFAMVTERIYANVRRVFIERVPTLPLPLPGLDQLAALDDASTAAMLRRIVRNSLMYAPETSNDDALRCLVESLPSLVTDEGILSGASGDVARSAVGAVEKLDPELVRQITQYIELEQKCAAISAILKDQSLRSLGLSNSMHIKALAQPFRVPNTRMRSVLGILFGLVLPQTDGELSADLT